MLRATGHARMVSDQCAANWCRNFNCSLGLWFGDGLGLWMSSGHFLLSRDADGLGLGFWVYSNQSPSRAPRAATRGA